MTLHLLKSPVNPLALRILSAQSPDKMSSSAIVLLSPSDASPALPKCTVYRVTANSASARNNDFISYDRLIDMLFEADHVITW